MKKIKFLTLSVIVSFVFVFFASNLSAQKKNNDKTVRKTETLTKSDKENILLMCEEEKLAYDVYTYFSERYDIPVFRNIPRSETRHRYSMNWLMEKYKIDNNLKPNAGEYTNPEIQKLYNQLTAQGTTLVEALKAGAYIEEYDIVDLKKHLNETKNEDIIRIYSFLLHGSENHLRAFVRNLSFRDAEYKPTILSQKDFDAIIEQ